MGIRCRREWITTSCPLSGAEGAASPYPALDVVQGPQEVDNGLPANSSQGVVCVSADQNFVFSAASVCVQSTVWRLQRDDSISNFIITTGGVEGNYGLETVGNWFRIDVQSLTAATR